MVTLDGGMSGGGNSVSHRAMSSKQAVASVSPATTKAYERDSDQAHQALQKQPQTSENMKLSWNNSKPRAQ